jgi:hypothetical protein
MLIRYLYVYIYIINIILLSNEGSGCRGTLELSRNPFSLKEYIYMHIYL